MFEDLYFFSSGLKWWMKLKNEWFVISKMLAHFKDFCWIVQNQIVGKEYSVALSKILNARMCFIYDILGKDKK